MAQIRGALLVVAGLLVGVGVGQLAPSGAEVSGVPVTTVPGGSGGHVDVPPAVCQHTRRGPVRCTTFESEWGRPLAIARRDWREADRQAATWQAARGG